VALARTGNCSEAIPLLERGLTADPLVAGFWLEICYSSEAERTADRLGAGKDQAVLHQLKGDLLLRLQGNAASAVGQYEEALKSRPQDPRLLERLAEAQLTAGDTEGARQSALAALAIDPRRSVAQRTLVSLAMSYREYDQALLWLRQLEAESPRDDTVQVQLSKALAQTGNSAEALKHLAPVLAAGYPDEKGALHALEARVLRALGRDDEAAKSEAEARRLSDAFQGRSKNGLNGGSSADQ